MKVSLSWVQLPKYNYVAVLIGQEKGGKLVVKSARVTLGSAGIIILGGGEGVVRELFYAWKGGTSCPQLMKG